VFCARFAGQFTFSNKILQLGKFYYIPTKVRLSEPACAYHQIYLARGRDHAGNHYADPTRSYPHLARYREQHGKAGH